MAKTESFTCDVCGVTKGEGNRWLMGFFARRTIDEASSTSILGYAVTDWDMRATSEGFIDHLCSEKCAFTRLGEHIRKDAPIGANVDVTA